MQLEELILSKLKDGQVHKSTEFHNNTSLVRKAIRELRLKGYPIKGTNNGYCMVTLEKIDEELATYRNRALKILQVYNRLKRLQKQYYTNRTTSSINFGGRNDG